MQKLIDTLVQIGMSEPQAQVYLAILENGASLTTEVAKKTGLKRTSVINYINELLQVGYLSQSLRGKRVVYIAESPEFILKKLEDQKEKFATQLPELNTLFVGGSGTTNIRYFEGKTGLRQIYQEVSTQFQPIKSFFSIEQHLSTLTVGDMDLFMANLKKYGNTLHDLLEDTPFAREFMKTRLFAEKTNTWLPTTFKIPIDLMVYGNCIAMISFKKQMGVIIENMDMANFHRTVHEHLFEVSEKV
ncbi:hypothetical protein MK079_05630 [Candidatus Gracilibacteria bacterium]|nr:hypothetical protein [Candidatus Gracilibacteria bacterium]